MNDEEFWANYTPAEIKPILYRLYYDAQGLPLFYSQEDLPGNYIDIDRETYINPPKHVKVVDGKFTVLNTVTVTKLRPSRTGTACHPNDVSIVVSDTQPHIKWSLK
jgi:hypothetical protein